MSSKHTRSWNALLALGFVLGACRADQITDVGSPVTPPVSPPPPPSSPPQVPTASTRPPVVVQGTLAFRDTVIGSLTVRPGATLQLLGTRLEVDGDLTIEAGGAIRGTQSRLDLIVRKNVTILSSIESQGHLVLVDDPAKVPSLTRLETERDTVTFDVINGPATPPSSVRQWNIHAPLLAGQSAGAQGAIAASVAMSGAGRSGGTVYINFVGNGIVSPPPNQPGGGPLVWPFKNGGDALDLIGCNIAADSGGTGQNLELNVSGTLVMNSVVMTGGDGGAGGDAVATQPCPNGAVNKGGKGGKPGNIHITVERFGLIIGALRLSDVHIRGWNGAPGGKAVITGINGAAAGAAGASVTAKGGAGSSLIGRRFHISSLTTLGPGPLMLAIFNSKDGGSARATGGNGAAGLCDANTGIASNSGDGGNGTAEGGAGGMVGVVTGGGSFPALVDATASFTPGVGGDAVAAGGAGADGVQCRVKGGDGGDGGAATSKGGKGGIGGQSGMLIYRDGKATSTGGKGGDGGHSLFEAGDGGAGGAANATGDKDSRADGGDGGDGGDIVPGFVGTAGDGGKGGDAQSSGDQANEENGGDGGDAGCPNGLPGGKGSGRTPGADGVIAC